jgi:hypothetical protein
MVENAMDYLEKQSQENELISLENQASRYILKTKAFV